jgi:hypothetical protein
MMTNPEPTSAEVVPFRPKSMLEVIAEAVRDPACDVVKMQAIIDMQLKLEAEEARKSFTRDFIALQAELPTINKDGLIDHGAGKQKSRYSTYPALMDICNPLLKRYGFSFSSAVEPTADGAGSLVASYLEHVSGHSRVSRRPLVLDTSGAKNAAQAMGSGQQYAMRYNIIALLNIVSRAMEDADNDGYARKSDFPGDRPMKDDPISSGPVRINKKQFEKLVETMTACGVTDAMVFKKYRVKKLTDLPASMLKDVVAACINYKKAKEIDNG